MDEERKMPRISQFSRYHVYLEHKHVLDIGFLITDSVELYQYLFNVIVPEFRKIADGLNFRLEADFYIGDEGLVTGHDAILEAFTQECAKISGWRKKHAGTEKKDREYSRRDVSDGALNGARSQAGASSDHR